MNKGKEVANVYLTQTLKEALLKTLISTDIIII